MGFVVHAHRPCTAGTDKSLVMQLTWSHTSANHCNTMWTSFKMPCQPRRHAGPMVWPSRGTFSGLVTAQRRAMQAVCEGWQHFGSVHCVVHLCPRWTDIG